MISERSSKRSGQWAAFLSMACAVHCAAFPVLLFFIPSFASSLNAHHWVEWLVIASVAVLAGYSIYHGYKNHHQSMLPVFLLILGLSLLISLHLLHLHENWFVTSGQVLGGLSIAGAQWANVRLGKNQSCSRCAH